MKDIELEIHSRGQKSRIKYDGQPIDHVKRVVVITDVDEVTTLEITAYKLGSEPYVIKGSLVEGDEVPRLYQTVEMLQKALARLIYHRDEAGVLDEAHLALSESFKVR